MTKHVSQQAAAAVTQTQGIIMCMAGGGGAGAVQRAGQAAGARSGGPLPVLLAASTCGTSVAEGGCFLSSWASRLIPGHRARAFSHRDDLQGAGRS